MHIIWMRVSAVGQMLRIFQSYLMLQHLLYGHLKICVAMALPPSSCLKSIFFPDPIKETMQMSKLLCYAKQALAVGWLYFT